MKNVVEPLKVLIVDDAVVVRRVLAELIGKDPALKVVGTAQDGRDGLEKMSLKPDVVVLDVEMPEVDGLQMLSELRRRGNKTPVVMFSSVTSRAATATMQALAAGASDYVTKPTARGGGLDQVVPELVGKLKLYGSVARRKATRGAPARAERSTYTLRTAPLQRPQVLVVASSTGGPMALTAVLPRLPSRISVPVLVVQHMPNAVFTEAISNTLAKLCQLPVEHAVAGRSVAPGVIVVAAGGSHLVLSRALTKGAPLVKLSSDPPLNGTRPAADALFKSAADIYGAGVLAVVLTGMGQDGLAGAEAIVRAGGSVIVQDEASSVVWGMPGVIAKAGLASAILPLPEVADEIEKRFGAYAGRVARGSTR